MAKAGRMVRLLEHARLNGLNNLPVPPWLDPLTFHPPDTGSPLVSKETAKQIKKEMVFPEDNTEWRVAMRTRARVAITARRMLDEPKWRDRFTEVLPEAHRRTVGGDVDQLRNAIKRAMSKASKNGQAPTATPSPVAAEETKSLPAGLGGKSQSRWSDVNNDVIAEAGRQAAADDWDGFMESQEPKTLEEADQRLAAMYTETADATLRNEMLSKLQEGGRLLTAKGMHPLDAYDVALMNLLRGRAKDQANKHARALLAGIKLHQKSCLHEYDVEEAKVGMYEFLRYHPVKKIYDKARARAELLEKHINAARQNDTEVQAS